MKTNAQDLWNSGVDLSEALVKFSPQELVKRFHGLRKRTKRPLMKGESTLLERANKSGDGANKRLAKTFISFGDSQDLRNRKSKVREEIVDYIVSALRKGTLIAIGFKGALINETPQIIPPRFLTARTVNFERNTIHSDIAEFRDVRVISKETTALPVKRGRPTVQGHIREAMRSLIKDGINLTIGAQKTHIRGIQERMRKLFGPSSSAAERTIRKAFKQNVRIIEREERKTL